MQIESISHLRSPPKMQSLRTLVLLRNNHLLPLLSKPLQRSPPPLLISLYSIGRTSHFSSRAWEEETRALSSHPDRNPGDWTAYLDQLEPRKSEKGKESGTDLSGEDEKPRKPDVKRKGRKVTVSWVCGDCGASDMQWRGQCRYCGEMNTMKEYKEYKGKEGTGARGDEVSEDVLGSSWLSQQKSVPQSLKEVNAMRDQLQWRIPL